MITATYFTSIINNNDNRHSDIGNILDCLVNKIHWHHLNMWDASGAKIK